MWKVGVAARQSSKKAYPFSGSRRCVSTFPRVDRQRREEVCNFVLSRFQPVRAVDGVVVDRFCKIGADGSRRSFFGIGRAHQLPIQRDRVSPSSTWIITGAELMKSTRPLKKGR